MTYASVELVLRIALVDLGDHVYRATAFVRLRPYARRLSNVASPPTASGEIAIERLALDAFANEASVSVDVGVRANVAGTYSSDQLLVLRVSEILFPEKAHLRGLSSELVL